MPLPVAHGLLGASIIIAARREIPLRKDWRAILVGAAAAIAPDFDLVISWGLGKSANSHGGATHSIVFSLFLGFLAAWILRESLFRSWMMFTSAAFSHALLDFLTKREFGGVALFWPFSSQKYKFGVMDYFEFYPDPGTDPLGPMIKRALVICGYEAMIFLPIFLLAVWIRSRRDRRRNESGVERDLQVRIAKSGEL